jgi:2Fe-2S ferredoxin
MSKVRVEPAGIEFEAGLGETLMAAAVSAGLYWPTTCGGQGICTTCLTEVVAGGEVLSEMSRYERKTLAAERGEAVLRRPVRLACQASVKCEGLLLVSKPGVRGSDEV